MTGSLPRAACPLHTGMLTRMCFLNPTIISVVGMPYCPPSQLTVPLFLKWAFVWDQPDDGSVWLARAAPRAMVAHKDGIRVLNVPTQFGRVSYSIKMADAEKAAHNGHSVVVSANITAPPAWGAGGGGGAGGAPNGDDDVSPSTTSAISPPTALSPPPGGLYLRLRLPTTLHLMLGAAEANGIKMHDSAIDTKGETVHFPSSILAGMDLTHPILLQVKLVPNH